MKAKVLVVMSLVLLLTVLSGTMVLADPPPHTPIVTGCPAGWEHLAVSDLEARDSDYRLPRIVDNAGNQDGFICAKEMPEAFRQTWCPPDCPVDVIYLFGDNDLPPYEP